MGGLEIVALIANTSSIVKYIESVFEGSENLKVETVLSYHHTSNILEHNIKFTVLNPKRSGLLRRKKWPGTMLLCDDGFFSLETKMEYRMNMHLLS